MEYGLIGEHLGHSFSREIHGMLSSDSYQLHEVAKEELDSFMRNADFKAINVTIPYKQAVIPYLSHISDEAKAIGAVNTIVNLDGKLYGYNTDFEGLRLMAIRAGIDFKGRDVLVLGVGGAAKTAHAVAASLGAATITHAARKPGDDDIDIYSLKGGGQKLNYHIIINATPVGMFPNSSDRVADLDMFPNLEGVLDCIYNPLRTNLVLDALQKGVKAEGGLYMLVAQACFARNYFVGANLGMDDIEKVYGRILSDKQNIVLSGMPSCGKSTIGKALAERSGKRFVDTDALIVERAGKEIPLIFKEEGEQAFRDMESAVIKELSEKQGLIISLGGGAVLRSENVRNLKLNGKIFFIDRKLELLTATNDRPLSSNADALREMYVRRLPVYKAAADYIIENNLDINKSIEHLSNIISQF
ncbi:MAG: hypothetical protein J6P34_05410 [Paludibacteraceae bacterium]|nr:hypothetical protein [Paludibacteraceae bacterium]MBO7367260.1 hypothetical protein [Paludibacteraceae bacterium]